MGSEMCIRDRFSPVANALSRLGFQRLLRLSPMAVVHRMFAWLTFPVELFLWIGYWLDGYRVKVTFVCTCVPNFPIEFNIS